MYEGLSIEELKALKQRLYEDYVAAPIASHTIYMYWWDVYTELLRRRYR